MMNFGFFKQCFRLAVFAICILHFALCKQEKRGEEMTIASPTHVHEMWLHEMKYR
jgi:hypothetical protein